MKNERLIIAVLSAVIIIGITVGGIGYAVLSARISNEETSLGNRLAALEKAQSKKPAAQTKTDAAQTAASAEAAKYGDWLTYANTEVGYTVRYPTDWTYTESTDEIDGTPVKNVTFYSPGPKYYVTVGLRVKGSSDMLSARTGIGQGDIKENGSIMILGVKVKKTDLVYKNKVKTVFYPNPGGIFTAQGFEGSAEFSVVDSSDYESFDLASVPEGIIADKIVSSMKITK